MVEDDKNVLTSLTVEIALQNLSVVNFYSK